MDRLACGARVGGDLGLAQLPGQTVEYAVHVFVPIGAAEFLGQLHAFIERDTLGHVQAVL